MSVLNVEKQKIVEFIVLAIKRAVWTFAQVALSMMVVGSGLSGTDWKTIIDVALGAAVISLLKSVVLGMPEFANDGNISISDNTCQVNLKDSEEELKSKKQVTLMVTPDTEIDKEG